MRQIADRAGVSIMTVSRVMSGSCRVSEDTAQRVQKIADELKYRPNQLVKGMQTGKTGLIGVIMPSEFAFYGNVLTGIHDALQEREASVLLSLVHGDLGKDVVEEERQRLLRLVDLRVEGIILRPTFDEASPVYFEEIKQRHIPLVVVDRQLPNYPCDFVGTDDLQVGNEAAQQLISKGCRDLLVLGAGDVVSTSRLRVQGFLEGARRHSGVKARLLDCGEFSKDNGRLRPFLAQPENAGIDGVFAVSDYLALIVRDVMVEQGKSIPGDISLIGCGNLLHGEWARKNLSTFDQQRKLIGQRAVELLEGRIKNKPSRVRSRKELIPAKFMDRGSA